MIGYDDNPHTKFGIDEVYINKEFAINLMDKLQQRAVFSLDSDDNIVHKNVSHDMILIFHKKVPSKNLIYRFLEFLHQYPSKEDYVKSNTLLNDEEELFAAIKLQKFVFVTHKTLSKETYSPALD